MAKHIVKCPVCAESFDANEVPYKKKGSRYYHIECYDKKFPRFVKCELCGQDLDLETEHKEERNKYYHIHCYEHLSAEKEWRAKLIAYMEKIFNQKSLSKKLMLQIHKIKKDNNYTYSGMYKTLYYFYEIKGNPFDQTKETIFIIPWIYQEALNYYKNIFELEHKNDNIQLEDKKNIVKISRPKTKNLIKIIDLEQFGG